MRDLIDLDDLLIYLYAECLLTRDDIEKLKVVPPHSTRNVVIRELAHLIERKGENGLVKFMSALRKSASEHNQPGHRDLLQLLEDDLEATTDCSSSPKQEQAQMEAQELPHPVPHTQGMHRRMSQKDQEDPPSKTLVPKPNPDPKPMNTSARDVLHELGCQVFNTREYHALQRYDHNVRMLIRCVCAVLLTYQFVAMTIVTLCEDGGFLAVFQESKNKYGVALRCFLLLVLRIGTRVITPVLFIAQFDVPATAPQISKSQSKVDEAIQQILKIFCPRHRKRLEARMLDPSAVINISKGLIKRHIKSSWIIVLHSLFFTWLLYYLGAFNMAVDKVIKREGICDINFLYTTTIHPPLVSSPISLLVLGECISILSILLIVGILKEFYLYENRIATYALVLGKEGEELYNMIRERWGTLDMYCYTTPPILFLLAGLFLFSGKGLTPEPSQEIEPIDVINWYFWIAILSALTFLATSQNIDLKRACLFGDVVAGVLLCIFKGEHLTIPAVSDCAVFLLYYCHAVILFNFHVSLLKCHYYHYKYGQTNSVASIYRLGYCLLCIGLLVISVFLSVHWEVFNFRRFL